MKKTKMKRFTVRRSNWCRGSKDSSLGMGDTWLLNLEGNMCCLGFACNQICRITKKQLLKKGFPSNVISNESTFVDKDGQDKDFVIKAVRINDAFNISDKVREYRLKKFFKANGILVTFKD